MGTNTGIGIGIGIPFRNNALGGDNIYFPPELKARMIGVWDNYGKKNTDADRNIIKNKIPNAGGDLEILNSAYKLNSGFGEYREDFTSWIVSKEPMTVEKTDSQVHISYIGTSYKELPMFEYSGPINENYSLTVEIQGIPNNVIGKFIHNNGFTQEVTNGINTIKFSNSGSWYGFTFYREDNTIIGDCNITIKQIPAFEGALVTDGINDIIASIKTLEDWNIGNKGITIVSMIHQINTNTNNFITTNNIRTDNKVIGRNIVSNIEKTGIYGWYKENIQSDTINVINNILGDKNDYTSHSSPSTNINPINNSKFYVQGYAIENGFTELSSVAHYWTFAVLGKATEDEINLIIAKYNLDRTLKPDILCNTIKQGISNENHAEFGDKLIDFSGNGRDIQLNNIAWDGDSGIGKYNYPNWKVNVTQGNKYARIVYYDSINGTYSANFKGITDLYKSYGLSIEIRVNRANTIDFHSIKEDGIYTITPPDDTTSMDIRFGGEDVYNASCNITITQIPSHAGAFCLDGVNDFGKVTGMPVYKDYTFIIEREFLNETFPNQVCLVSKSKVASEIGNGGAFIVDNISVNSIINPYSFYKTTSLPGLNTFDRQIVFQSKYKYLDKDIAAGTATDSDTLWLGTFRDNDSRFANVAIYSLMSFPYSMSKFLIERQLKKHKLGTLYPNMVEFRPIIKQDDRIKNVKYYKLNETADYIDLNIGDYIPVGQRIAIVVDLEEPYKITSITSSSLTDVEIRKAGGQNYAYDILGYVTDKSPQKITMDIQVDSSLVQWNPVVESNAEYQVVDFYIDTYPAVVGNYYLISSKLRVVITTKGAADEVTSLTVNGVSLGTPSINGNRFTFNGTLPDKSPQNINIAIDEYIRFEDIVQPYPVLLRFNDENGNEVSWGGKLRVGSTITRIGSAADSNLLPNIYNIFGLLLNDNQVTSSKVIVEKTMVFKAKSAYIFDNNEPNCILSPRLLRIPNSSYKILGYIPDISGHGNHGVIHNSAYIEGSGVNKDGSYQFDGVDDFVTIPTVTGGGKQVLMKVNNNTINSMLYDQRSSSASPNSLNSDFAIYNTNTVDNNLIAYQSRLVGKTYIDGILNTNITCEDLLGVLHNITITCDIVVPNNGVVPNIGRGGVLKDLYSKVALYDFMLFDNISTDDKIKELNEYVGIEAKVELPPYYWDAYGKTNLDADKATIQQRGTAVGDYDITNYNHAYDKMSGYGGYNLGRFDKSWASSSSSNTSIKVVQRNPYDITLKKLGGNSDWEFNNTELKVISNPVSVKFKSNKNIRVTCDYHYYPVGGNSEGTPLGITSKDLIANKDAIITISPISQENIDKYNIDVNRGYYLIYFQLSSTLAVNEEVTIEMLPLYTNGLAYDGITDYSENTNIPALTDYTYVFKRELLNLDKVGGGASLYKGSFYSNGGRAFIVDINDKNPNSEMSGYSYGNRASTSTLKTNKIIYGTKTSVNGVSVTPGSNTDNASLTLGKWDVNYKQMVFYKLILYPKTIPLLQINFLKNLMEKDEIIDLDNPIFKK